MNGCDNLTQNECGECDDSTQIVEAQGLFSEIIFSPGYGSDWTMKINHQGIFFNRQAYASSQPNDFAEAVIKILETAFMVKFEKKTPPYNRPPASKKEESKLEEKKREFEAPWIDAKEHFPPTIWKQIDGKWCFEVTTVLLLRKMVFNDGVIYCTSVGEYDTDNVPSIWRAWEEWKDRDGCHDVNSIIVDDVIAWTFIPEIPKGYTLNGPNRNR